MTTFNEKQAKILELLSLYSVSKEQRDLIIEVSTKPLADQQWFYDQFTRNR